MASPLRSELRQIFAAALEAVDPGRLVSRAVVKTEHGLEIGVPGERSTAQPLLLRGRRLAVYGAGKAAAAMASAMERVGGPDLEGCVIAPEGAARPTGRRPGSIRILAGEHPIPGRRTAQSTRQLMAAIAASTADGFVFLLSGGASSLLAEPLAPLTLADKQEVTRLLLGCGAAIEEVNTVRKHLSAVKGGRLLRLAGGRPIVTLILSDVIGDDVATIGSGPTVADTTTYAQAIEVLRRHGVYERCPPAAVDILEQGSRGAIAETVRPGSEEARLATAIVIGSNATALAACERAAARHGYAVQTWPTPLRGDTVECARHWFQSILSARDPSRRCCFIAGGETTVSVRGSGTGGRNQEFSLALADLTHGRDVVLLSAGTDGVDGPTDAAGAYVDGTTLERAARRGLDPEAFLRDNDSFHFFSELGDLLVTGPTGTNVMDVKIALFGAPSAP